MDGYLSKGLLNPSTLQERHGALAIEMKRRGMKHSTPLEVPDTSYLDLSLIPTGLAKIARDALHSRCPECVKRYEAYAIY